MQLFPQKYYLVFLQNTGTEEIPLYDRIATKRIDITKNTKCWRDKEFTYSRNEISYRNGRNYFIFKDFDNGKTVFEWHESEAQSPDGIKQRNKERLMDKAMQVNPHDYGLAFVIIAAIAGLAGGAIIMVVAYPSIFPEMMKKTAQATAKLAMILC